MSLDAMRAYCEGVVQSTMRAQYPLIPIRFENAPFKQPSTAFAACCVVDGKSLALNLGTKKFDRHVGFVQFDALVPQETGTATANQMVTVIGMQFRERKVSLSDGAVATFKTPSYHCRGVQNGFFSVCCSVAYWRDEPAQ